MSDCERACEGAQVVLHHAALGSVPRSIADPLTSHQVNADGFVNMLISARDLNVRRFVYASSSSVYGDHSGLPKVEMTTGNPLSPYAATKTVNEAYAEAFSRAYGMKIVGLRYFNVFGSRQDPEGPYAAVIPRWITALLSGTECVVYGDGSQSRDFCPVEDVAHINWRAGTVTLADHPHRVYNVALSRRTALRELLGLIEAQVARFAPGAIHAKIRYAEARVGDVPHSLADIHRAVSELGYRPPVDLEAGLAQTVEWFASQRNPPD